MRTGFKTATALCAVAIIVAIFGHSAQAKPGFGVSCGRSGCHTNSRNAITVINHDTLTDLGEGDLKTFTVEPGQTASLSVTVIDGHDKYGVAFKDFDTGGIVESPSNMIVFVAGSGWVNQTGQTPPYYVSTSSSHNWGGSSITYTFDMHVDESTPADYYALQFETAGKNGGKWSEREKFYLHVTSPQPTPGNGDIDGDGDVDMYDLTLLGARWRNTGCAVENEFCNGADVNIDGTVDFNDVIVLATRWLFREPLAIPVAAGDDDAEQSLLDNSIDLGSSDLELINDTDDQLVGIRFNNVQLNQADYIGQAYVQFTVDEISTGPCNIIIEGQASDNAGQFSSTPADISARPATTGFVEWSIPNWPTTGTAGPDQQTPDLAVIIEEIINRPGWTPGNSIVLIFSGAGTRTAESYNGSIAEAPVLHIQR